MEGKNHQRVRDSKPGMPPPLPEELLEDDAEGVTGVVRSAHQSSDERSKAVDAERQKVADRMQALRDKLSNSGPIALRPRRASVPGR